MDICLCRGLGSGDTAGPRTLAIYRRASRLFEMPCPNASPNVKMRVRMPILSDINSPRTPLPGAILVQYVPGCNPVATGRFCTWCSPGVRTRFAPVRSWGCKRLHPDCTYMQTFLGRGRGLMPSVPYTVVISRQTHFCSR